MVVSVIIPTYNSEKYIASAVKSVLEQTYRDLELIIVDDGSVDKSREIIGSFNDARIKYIYQDNAGVAAARNKGILHSSGDYIAFLDADDIWEKDKLRVQIDRIKQDDGIAMVYGAIEMFYENSEMLKIFRYKNLNQKEFIENLVVDPFKTVPFPSTVVIRRSMLDKVGDFNTTLPTGEDWDLFLRLAAYGKCVYMDEVFTKKLTHHASITNSIDLKVSGNHHFWLLDNFFFNNPEYSHLRKRAYSMIYYDIACRYLGRHGHVPTKELYINLIKSFLLYPKLYLERPKLTFAFNVTVRHYLNGIMTKADQKC